MGTRTPLCLFCIVIVSLITRSDSSLSNKLLGISPHDEDYYKPLFSSSLATIKCKDGSNKFTKCQLNDDFCDCPDGTDEPGTSACLKGKFYCLNAGHFPLTIYSSRVNDGICDCCDGSDEYDGKSKCSNTCWEAGKAARDKLKRKIATFKEGVIVRKKEVEQAKVAIEKDEAELIKLKGEEKILKGLVQQLKEHTELIEKAEEKERMQKEKEEKEKKEAEEAEKAKSGNVKEAESKEKPLEKAADEKIGILEDLPLGQDTAEQAHDSPDAVEHGDNIEKKGLPEIEVQEDVLTKEPASPGSHEADIDNLNKKNDLSEETSSLSKEELGRRVASQWIREDSKQVTESTDFDKNENHVDADVSSKDALSEQNEGYDSETDDDSHRYDDEEDEDDVDDHVDTLGEENSDDSSSSYPPVTEDDEDSSDLDVSTASDLSWLEKIQQSVRSILQVVNLFQPRVNISEAARVRKEYDESSAKLSKIQSRISSLTKKLEKDFGPEKEFFSFYKKCFEMKQNKYTYKVCPFKQASQEEGYSSTRLGNWDKFEESYRVMVFSSGDKCWNGPDRSLKVRLRCGLNNEVTDVDEPSRCEYVALLATPALCAEEKLKELEGKLELMNKQQPQGHDEL